MISGVIRKVFGTKNDRELKRMGRVVQRINALGEEMGRLSDEELPRKTEELRRRHAEGETLDELMPEAFALVRETAERVLGERPFDVQLIGAIALHEGRIAEMRTGEGKTLVATLPAYLNALPGEGVHIVTVNDYLARRDAAWMGPIYEKLGLSVAAIWSGQPQEEKRAAYAADITYATNNELGFDYLRDNMAFTVQEKVQRRLNYAIIDEVDSILIDEARTPLIISGPSEQSTDLFVQINRLAPRLKPQIGDENDPEGIQQEGDFTVDEKHRQVELTERGHGVVEEALTKAGLLAEGESLYAPTNLNLVHHVHAALRAHVLFKRDVDYIVRDGQVVIVDEHTGRAMPGRRWSDGLHSAIEAKEGLTIQSESQTLASITLQNYFRMYAKLAGMTGTASTEAFEFHQIYGLDVVIIPTHKPMIRKDHNDLVFMTMDEKFQAIVDDVKATIDAGAPVLIGTASVDASERLSHALDKAGIEHSVLNAKQHAREAEIIAQAGRPGVVTLATNMAGRGTDIVLGGNWKAEVEALEDPTPEQIERIKADWRERHEQVVAAGGLHIIGTERHESRRIDNQLRGRAGRQGDPGSSRFFLSMEDNLMRIFASDRVRSIMGSLGIEEGEAIEHRMVSNAIEKAQRKVEGHNFDMRKNLLEFDDVANDQRQMIYAQRNELMESDDISDMVESIREEVVSELVSEFIPPQSIEEQWDVEGLERALATELNAELPLRRWLDEEDSLNEERLRERILEHLHEAYREKEARWRERGVDIRVIEKQLMLQTLDRRWKEHQAAMDHLRQSIHLRAYAQKQPKQEYKREAFGLFQELLASIKRDAVRLLSRMELERESSIEEEERRRRAEQAKRMSFSHQTAAALEDGAGSANGDARAGDGARERTVAKPETFVRQDRKVGRNEPCPCGSGKKYKRCHGQS